MSATLGVLLKQLNPDISLVMYERLEQVANESSNPWNNAGTGHAALCELNYMGAETMECSESIMVLRFLASKAKRTNQTVEDNIYQITESGNYMVDYILW